MKKYNAYLKLTRDLYDQFTHGQIKVDMTILNSMQQAALYKEKLEKEKEEAEKKEERIKSAVKKFKK